MGKFAGKSGMLKDGRICSIRELTGDDAEEMVKYMQQVVAETNFLAYEPDEFKLTVDEERELLNKQALSERNLMIAAKVDNQVVGSLGFQGSTRKRFQHRGSFGISVLQEYWGLGIGKLLMESLVSFAEDTGITKINLQVRTDNTRAVALYKKMGFGIEGIDRWGIRIDGEYYDFYLMGLLVD